MAVSHIYKCDKCGAEQPNADQFWTVGVSANMATYSSDHYIDRLSMQVCRPCLESFGIHVQAETKKNTNHNPPSLEDPIREIVTRCVEIPGQ